MRSFRFERRERGFTLIELLIVIFIIALLGTMIVTAVGRVRQRALVAKAVSNIGSFRTALGTYNMLTGVYPQRGNTPVDDPEALFRALYTGTPRHGGSRENHLADWPVEQLGLWTGANPSPGAYWAPPSDAQLDCSQSFTPIAFLDPWGRPYHYVQWESFPENQRRLASGSLKAKGGAAFAIWSDGANKENEWGGGDDVNSWSEGSGH